MKNKIYLIFIVCSVYCVLGAYIKPNIEAPEQVNRILNQFDLTKDVDDNSEDGQPNQRAIKSVPSPVSLVIPSANISDTGSSNSSQIFLNRSTINLVEKVLANLRNRPISSQQQVPNKQLLGGKLPGFLERIVQRIQNYFSVYNPPEYFEGNRPPATSNDGIAVVCSNVENDDLSCGPIPPEEYGVLQQQCEDAAAAAAAAAAAGDSIQNVVAVPGSNEDGYNIVVTHTVVHDNTISVYSPQDPAAGPSTSQVVSNVVVILEPSAAEYTPPSTQSPVRSKDKFYVYVNPTAANKKKDQFKTKGEPAAAAAEGADRPEPFQPYNNATYTVIIKGGRLQEFSNNIENADNGALNPEIASQVRDFADFKKYAQQLQQPQPQQDEESGAAALASRSVIQPANKQFDVPNINVVLVPPDHNNRSSSPCGGGGGGGGGAGTGSGGAKDKYENGEIEYYILKPDPGNIGKPKDKTKNSGTNLLKKTAESDATAATYLPPEPQFEREPTEESAAASGVAGGGQPSTGKFPTIFNLFKKKVEEPRTM